MMCGYKRGNSTIGTELIEITCAFLLAMLIGWAMTNTAEGGEVWQENNSEAVGRP